MKYIPLLTGILIAQLSFAEVMPPAERLQFADGLMSRGMHDLAANEYKSFISDYPKGEGADTAHYRLAECYRQMGNTNSARDEYRYVFKNYPASSYASKAGFRLGDLFLEEKHYKEAINQFNKVIELKPDADTVSACIYYSADAYMSMNSTNEAVQAYERLRKEYEAAKFNSFGLLKLAELYLEMGKDVKQVIGIYEEAAAKKTSDRVAAEALFQAASLHFREKAYDKSADAYRKLLKEHPGDYRVPEAKIKAGWASYNAGVYAEALGYAEEVLSNTNVAGADEWFYLKANAQRQLMKNEDAVKTYSELIQKYPESKRLNQSYYENALVYYRMGRIDNVIADAQKVDLNADRELKKQVYWLLAEAYDEKKDADHSIQYYTLLIKEFPDDQMSADAGYKLGYIMQERGDTKQAASYFGDVAAKFPTHKIAPQALFASGVCNLRQNKHSEAVRDWGNLIRTYPANPLLEDAFYQKGMAEVRLKRDKDAIESLGTLTSKFPKSRFSPDAFYWQAVLMKEQGRDSDAMDYLKKAEANSPKPDLQNEINLQQGLLLRKAGKLDDAAAKLSSVLKTQMKDKMGTATIEWLAQYYYEKQKYGESLEAAGVLMEFPKNDNAFQSGSCLAGRCYLKQGNQEKAEAAYRKAVEIVSVKSAYYAESALMLGDMMLKRSDVKEAKKFYETAGDASSDESMLAIRARAYIGLGKAAKSANDYENAARYFLSVSILFDDTEIVPECLYEAASAFYKAGKAADGDKALKELRDRYPKSQWVEESKKIK